MTEDLTADEQPAPRTGAELPARDPARLQALADSLGCLLADDVQALANVTFGTLETWAKRGEGPPYVLLGKRRLYPREGLREFLLSRVRARGISARSLL